MNMGQCISNGNSFMCKCPPGFTGKNCESRDPCTPNPVIFSQNTTKIIFYYKNIFILKIV